MKNKIVNLMNNNHISGQVARYLIMASIVVTIEVGSFWAINSKIGINYLMATVLSMAIGIVLNWLGSKLFVFNKSRFHPVHEFILVAVVSLVGVGLQLMTIYLVVTKAHTAPLVGKINAIVVTFVWNFFIRRIYIFKPRE